MIEHRGTLISEDLFEKRFVCDLNACKGACCEQGDSGAPITPEEAAEIKKYYPAIEPYMTARGKKAKGYRTVIVGSDAMAGCSSLTFDKAARQIVLMCI